MSDNTLFLLTAILAIACIFLFKGTPSIAESVRVIVAKHAGLI